MHKKYQAWRSKAIERRQLQREAGLTGMIEQSTPYYPLNVYPKDWRELAGRRDTRLQKTQTRETPHNWGRW